MRSINSLSTVATSMNKKKQLLLNNLYAQYQNHPDLLVKDGSKRIIFGEGNPDAKLVFIGEAPGAKEDELQRPFVGRSGQLLNTILAKYGIKREDTFITNIVKVRPPNNRTPSAEELEKGRELLFQQLAIIQPKVICTLGASALEGLLNKKISITNVRGTLLEEKIYHILPTFHPAYILRSQNKRPILEQDIKKAVEASQIK